MLAWVHGALGGEGAGSGTVPADGNRRSAQQKTMDSASLPLLPFNARQRRKKKGAGLREPASAAHRQALDLEKPVRLPPYRARSAKNRAADSSGCRSRHRAPNARHGFEDRNQLGL
ncbi:hypothetical protein CKO42_20965 [Lamprobacter modestohalophilus]|uniref:Uncharacterized protein n=1 Tax=Lamprobacter modestohalophilus TaxID=1064514 RepID=A0A9X1B6L8_9GAMM|nr:hypothetical protein [Lamprobacter modestohalophilus]